MGPYAVSCFAITKLRLMLATSLIFTWWLAHIMSLYSPVVQEHVTSTLEEAKTKIPSIKVEWNRRGNGHTQYNASKLALLIEPRPMPHLVPLILHMIAVVPLDWQFLFIGSDWSVAALGRAYGIRHQQMVGKLNSMVLPQPWRIQTQEDVSRLLTDLRFYDEILPGVEWLFKYEHDSILCANSEKSVDDWLSWSWAGAARDIHDQFPGPGGLSIRRVSSIRRILDYQARYNDTEPEDEWFGKRLLASPGETIATGLEASFVVEDVFVEKPMGFHIRARSTGINHNIWRDPARRKAIFEYCPEISMIMDMKLERERCPDDDMMGGRIPEPLGYVAQATQRAVNAQPVPRSPAATSAQAQSDSLKEKADDPVAMTPSEARVQRTSPNATSAQAFRGL